MLIVGAGMAGCIAGIVNPKATILEAQSDTSVNHRAVLRFRSDEISKVTGIPFTKVNVNKGIWYEGKEVPISTRMISLYSQKVLGCITPRSIVNVEPAERYIAPSDFHAQLIDMLGSRVEFNSPIHGNDLYKDEKRPIISTMPMQSLLKLLLLETDTEFLHQPITTTRWHVPGCSLHATIYYPEQVTPIYRATLTGEDLIMEHMEEVTEWDYRQVFDSFGISTFATLVEENHTQRYGKILDIDDAKRKQIIFELTTEFGIYSLGRFAIWKNILLDDVLDDLYVIRRFMKESDYDKRRTL